MPEHPLTVAALLRILQNQHAIMGALISMGVTNPSGEVRCMDSDVLKKCRDSFDNTGALIQRLSEEVLRDMSNPEKW
jgi:hypothetical protein